MARNRDNSPVPQTCPMIDWVISEVNSFYSSGDPVSSSEAQDIENKMEKIRQANIELREWGNEQNNRANELDGELYDANKEIESLKKQIQNQKEEISELEEKIENSFELSK